MQTRSGDQFSMAKTCPLLKIRVVFEPDDFMLPILI